MSDRTFVLAVDVGQARDYTAMVVLDTLENRDANRITARPNAHRRYDVVDIERFREVPYPQQVERIRDRFREVERIARHHNANARLVVDATGVGKPILDALKDQQLRPTGVIITGGDTASESDGVKRVPKRELVTTLQIVMQQDA
jgi:hypothetical protein